MTAKVEYLGKLSTRCTHLKSGSSITTDAPTDNNGLGQAFSPTDLVVTALASCMLTVMGIKAAKSDIPFEQIDASVTKVMGNNPRRIVEVNIKINVKENWTVKQKNEMEDTAANCPVTYSLNSDIQQNTTFIYT